MRKLLINILISLGLIAGLLFLLGKSPVIADEAAPAADINVVVAGNTEFAFDLYARLKDHPAVKKADGNLFFSPYSISTALAMTYCGARGRTAEQMAQTLKFPYDKQRVHLEGRPNTRRPWMELKAPWELPRLANAFGTLEKNLKAEPGDSGYELNVANALWGQAGYAFLDTFLELNRKYYGAGLKEVDFAGQTEKARKTINAWIEKQTKDKIKDLIQPGSLDPLTRLVLTNAIYFKGDWASKFKENATKTAAFHISEDREVQVPMMYQKGKFEYGESKDAQTLVLPYKGDELSMVVILPGKVGALASVERDLTSGRLKSVLEQLRKSDVSVYLPKFKMTTETIALKGILKEMGMTDAFSERLADFSGMEPKKELFIWKVLHKAFVEVNEEGTEAAAASAVVMKLKSMPPPVPVFRADRPFVFMIRDNRSGSILFLGRVMNPAIEGGGR
ncbi:MAG: serpin family protein [Planctomycetota bacterium]|jgi:serpin B